MAADPQRKDLTVAGKNADWWGKEVARSVKDWRDYRDRAQKVIERYRDEREDAEENRKRFNILYSNTETLGPAIYSQVPVPDIRRRYQDKDPVGRVAAEVLQRSVSYCLESYDFDGLLEACRQDYLLPGFAVARVEYKPYFKQTAPVADADASTESPTEDKAEGGAEEEAQPAAPQEELIYQEAATRYVPWNRFAMSRSKSYDRVWWVAYGDDLTKEEIRAQFGDKIAEGLNYARGEDSSDEKDDAERTCRIWEVWVKRGRQRFFIAEGYRDGFIRPPEPDPLRLENFFPNPKPIWAVATNNTLEPIPEYCEYQDQARELDDLTDRIDVLTSALRRRGVYAASCKELQDVVNAGDNEFKPVENFQALMEKGGLANLISEMPIEGIAAIILQLDERRDRVKQTIYEVTGIADIVRGASNPNETATAQTIKGRWAGLRVSTRQKKFANFARDLVRLKAEIIAERFDAQTLGLMSGIELPMAQQKMAYQQMQAAQQQQFQQAGQQYQAMAQQAQQAGQRPPPPPQAPQVNPDEARFYAQPTWEDVLQVLRNDKLRGFKIDIETDSTVQPDADAEKQARNELLAALGGYCQQMAPAVQSGLIPRQLAIDAIRFTLRAYKAGSEFEDQLDSMATAQSGPTPQQQQMQKMLQDKEKELGQRESKARDQEHQAALAAKDAQSAGEKVNAQQQMFDLKVQHADEIQRLHDQFQKQMEAFMQQAETTVKDIINRAAAPQSGAMSE